MSCRNSRTSCGWQPGHPGRAAFRAAARSGHIVIDGEEITVDRKHLAGSDWARVAIGGGRARDGRPTRRSRACGGSTSDGFRRLRDCADHPGGPDGFRSLNHSTRIWRDGRVETPPATPRDPLPVRHPHPDPRYDPARLPTAPPSTSTSNRNCRCPFHVGGGARRRFGLDTWHLEGRQVCRTPTKT